MPSVIGREPIDVSQAVHALLIGYPWPGNVRELAAWTERLYVTGFRRKPCGDAAGRGRFGPRPPRPDRTSLQQVERQAIVHALERSNFNQRKAARMLQVHRATLARKLKKHRLT